jgi:hypothetical protein
MGRGKLPWSAQRPQIKATKDGPSELENALGFSPSAQPDGDADEFFDVVDYDENGVQLEEIGLLSVNTVEKAHLSLEY